MDKTSGIFAVCLLAFIHLELKLGVMVYVPFTVNMTWDEAKQHCENNKFVLARIEAEEEAKSVPPFRGGRFWVGGKKNSNGTFVWVYTGDSIASDLFNSSGGDECVCFVSDDLRIATAPCLRMMMVLCMSSVSENPGTETTEPNTTGPSMSPTVSPTPKTEEPDTREPCPYDGHEYQARHICNCSQEACAYSAHCNRKTECARGWFAFSCIYLDLGVHANMSHASLNDNDDLTCHTSSDGSAEVNFSEPIQFTWLRIVLGVKEKLDKVSLTFYGTKEGTLVRKCEDPSLLETGEGGGVLDIECPNNFKVTRLKVSWYKLMSVCSIHINGGRNLINHQVAILHSEKSLDEKSVPEMTDEVIGCDSCVELNGHAILITRLANYGVIQYIFLYTLDTGAKNFTLSFRASLDRTGISYPVAMESGLLIKITNTNWTEPIQYIVLTIHSYSLWICEIEVYGECPSTFYGPDCDKPCDYTCVNDTCNYMGICHRCALGAKGKDCIPTTEGTAQKPVVTYTTNLVGPKRDHIRENTSMKIAKHLTLFLLVLLCLAATTLICLFVIKGNDVKAQRRFSENLQIEISQYSVSESAPAAEFQGQRRHSESLGQYSQCNVDAAITSRRHSSLSKLEVKSTRSLPRFNPLRVLGFTRIFQHNALKTKARQCTESPGSKELPRADPTSNVESQTRSSEVKRASPMLSLTNNHDENVLGRNESRGVRRNSIIQMLQALKRNSAKRLGKNFQDKEGGLPKVTPRIIRRVPTPVMDATAVVATLSETEVGSVRKGKFALTVPASKTSTDYEARERRVSRMEITNVNSRIMESTMAFMTSVFSTQSDTKPTLEHYVKKDGDSV